MNISVQKLLGKMEKELLEAKSSSSDARIRERVQAIKSLCELVLEESDTGSVSAVASISHTYNAPPAQPAGLQPKKMQMEDEANGDSLFDF
ncbi:YwdI family protein [Cytobacillus oceanisediminis]|uniref:YwdI family protein n=1 Tax=Cytobacillus oceanisediminis TaxID=665099 RepID=UPI00203FFE3F|nr:YwdI family protein [Cytobacillus oceanisediminis]MCM3528828.1 YwdI family protein [Cytobacillus oceanisediminis]